jgi:O-antigen/teichoic acid export membrane protein
MVSVGFAKKGLILQIGSLGGTLVQAAANVMLARWLGPSEYGSYAIAFSLAGIASIVLGAGAFDALAARMSRAWHQRDNREIDRLMLFLSSFVWVTALLGVMVGVLLPLIAEHLYGLASLGHSAVLLVCGAIVSTTVLSHLLLVAQVSDRISALSFITLLDQVVRFGLSLLFVRQGMGVAGACFGQFLGALVVAGICVPIWRRMCLRSQDIPHPASMFRLSFGVLRSELGLHTAWVMADRNLAMLYSALPVALMGMYALSTDVSYFKISFGYLSLALSVLGPISTLLNTELGKIPPADTSRLEREFIRATWLGIFVSCLVTLGALLVSRPVFALLYGGAYDEALPYVWGFIIHGGLFGIGVALGPMWRALERVKVSIVINVVTLGIGVPLGIIAMRTWHVWGGVAAVTLWYAISHIISYRFIRRALHHYSVLQGASPQLQ